MYVTRPLSMYKKSPSALSEPPPEGPSSGILVVQDDEAQPRCCFGLMKSDRIRRLPLPQNKKLEIYYAQGFARDRDLHFHSVWFIPVLDQPLSLNRYYAVHPFGKDRGEAFTSCKEDDLETFCFYNYAPETQPQPLDPKNEYQQVDISLHGRHLTPWGSEKFKVKSVAPDGFAPGFLGRKSGWKLTCADSPWFELGEANGVDEALRARLPGFDFPLGNDRSKPVVVGKWYCPFVFVKEGTPKTMKDEKRNYMFYEMTLEQNWELIYGKENDNGGSSVVVDAVIRSEVVVVEGEEEEAVVDESFLADGVLWFRSVDNVGKETSVGLSLAVVERMKWEQERVGWVKGKEEVVRIERTEECGGLSEWKRFGCYVLTERFVLKRMDGSLALSHEFRHTHQIRSKWE
ncbi:hypothetical protein TorRG33x02_194980 [Trema orientale]|uniref:Uncharacterized protein n=1 Tax=Trema orientale TaxID=63057 RepID=A0A2P5EGI0_TREOI|nr:hypothetical protein TorRG33x02_194980 [Trema orientale]